MNINIKFVKNILFVEKDNFEIIDTEIIKSDSQNHLKMVLLHMVDQAKWKYFHVIKLRYGDNFYFMI